MDRPEFKLNESKTKALVPKGYRAVLRQEKLKYGDGISALHNDPTHGLNFWNFTATNYLNNRFCEEIRSFSVVRPIRKL